MCDLSWNNISLNYNNEYYVFRLITDPPSANKQAGEAEAVYACTCDCAVVALGDLLRSHPTLSDHSSADRDMPASLFQLLGRSRGSALRLCFDILAGSDKFSEIFVIRPVDYCMLPAPRADCKFLKANFQVMSPNLT